ncbi:flagellar biosynthesis anti-sigma factor FlgM [Pectinatus haikarae]|uniref:flagellar biosynthesis anti-sigma factor FlgM n=1 Tax=Pectinatus haikarae TaxID=349096 RepID=UPI0018C6BD12|nr:flagellar biosynthesis anti-sigma factor FlgM [Pectinatus haikarae]
MMISNSNHIHSITNVYMNSIDKSVVKNDAAGETSNAGDEILLSSESQEFSSYLNKLRDMPEVRTGIVDNYRDLINNNKYRINTDELSEKILNGSLL